MSALPLSGTRLGLLSKAIAAAEDGAKIRRDGWPPKWFVYVARRPQDLGADNGYYPPDITFPTYVFVDEHGGKHLGWTPERGDMSANDWRIA